MGPRPVDFDEEIIRQSPTFIKWLSLQTGEKLRYACREFVKDYGDDEERLMRRIMIARRNNLRDHEVLKQARKQIQHVPTMATTSLPAARESVDHDDALLQDDPESYSAMDVNSAMLPSHQPTVSVSDPSNVVAAASSSSSGKTSSFARTGGRRPASTVNDQHVEKEMDVAAVEATRCVARGSIDIGLLTFSFFILHLSFLLCAKIIPSLARVERWE